MGDKNLVLELSVVPFRVSLGRKPENSDMGHGHLNCETKCPLQVYGFSSNSCHWWILSFCIWYDTQIFILLMCGNPVASALFVKKFNSVSLKGLGILVKNQLAINVEAQISGLSIIFCWFTHLSLCHWFDYCIPENGETEKLSSLTVSFLKIVWSSRGPCNSIWIEDWHLQLQTHKKGCWDLGWDCTGSVVCLGKYWPLSDGGKSPCPWTWDVFPFI